MASPVENRIPRVLKMLRAPRREGLMQRGLSLQRHSRQSGSRAAFECPLTRQPGSLMLVPNLTGFDSEPDLSTTKSLTPKSRIIESLGWQPAYGV